MSFLGRNHVDGVNRLVMAKLLEAGTNTRDAESPPKLLGSLRHGIVYRFNFNPRNRAISAQVTFTKKSAAHQPYSNSFHPLCLLTSHTRIERVDDVAAVQDFLYQVKGTIIVVVGCLESNG